MSKLGVMCKKHKFLSLAHFLIYLYPFILATQGNQRLFSGMLNSKFIIDTFTHRTWQKTCAIPFS